MKEEALEILTPNQRETWAKLTAPRTLPANPPEMPAPSEAATAAIKVDEASPVFHLLAERAEALQLSDAQKKLLKTLDEVTQEGLYWISLKNRQTDPSAADRVSQSRAEFLKEAEQVALLGILTEKQASQLQSAVKPPK